MIYVGGYIPKMSILDNSYETSYSDDDNFFNKENLVVHFYTSYPGRIIQESNAKSKKFYKIHWPSVKFLKFISGLILFSISTREYMYIISNCIRSFFSSLSSNIILI